MPVDSDREAMLPPDDGMLRPYDGALLGARMPYPEEGARNCPDGALRTCGEPPYAPYERGALAVRGHAPDCGAPA
jgi:hypothetical protein